MVFKPLDMRQRRPEIHKRQETNEVNPITSPVHCLDSYQVTAQEEGTEAKAVRLPALKKQRDGSKGAQGG